MEQGDQSIVQGIKETFVCLMNNMQTMERSSLFFDCVCMRYILLHVRLHALNILNQQLGRNLEVGIPTLMYVSLFLFDPSCVCFNLCTSSYYARIGGISLREPLL